MDSSLTHPLTSAIIFIMTPYLDFTNLTHSLCTCKICRIPVTIVTKKRVEKFVADEFNMF